jgi:hypothetical protein
VTLREHLEADHGLTIGRDVASRPIRYRGLYDPVDGVVRGTWRMRSGAIYFWSRGRLFRAIAQGASGDWSMRRQFG